jgi:2-methylaconitate cis-trans-isomerase PrpF
MNEMRALPCSIFRGGTSRAVFFKAEDLPRERAAIEPVLLNVLGSPDIRQINGLGGATSNTSKAAIIGRPTRDDADIDYMFAQVSFTSPVVDWGGNCGNISSAVGPYAVDMGFVQPQEPITTVRVHNTNTGKIIVEKVHVANGRAVVDGDFQVPGVPGTGARIMMTFLKPGGSSTGALLPTGRVRETFELADGRCVTGSIVDAANPVVFVLAKELAIEIEALPQAIEARPDVTSTLEEIRSIAAERIGIADRRTASLKSPGLPKVGFVGPPGRFKTVLGSTVEADGVDLQGRLMSMQTAHRTYMLTGAICTGAAAFTKGTVVNDVTRAASQRPDPRVIRIGHPYGVMKVSVDAGPGDIPEIFSITADRTARHILDGVVYVPSELFGAEGRVAELAGIRT